MEYCAKVNIGVPGYGRLTPGEYLDEKCKETLGEDALNDLVKRGALRCMADNAPEPERDDANREAPEPEAPEENGEAPGEEPDEEPDEDEEAVELEPDTMDDLVDEAMEAPAPKPTPKKNNNGRRRAK